MADTLALRRFDKCPSMCLFMWFYGYREFIQAVKIEDECFFVFRNMGWEKLPFKDILKIKIHKYRDGGVRIIVIPAANSSLRKKRFRIIASFNYTISNIEPQLDALENELRTKWPTLYVRVIK